MSARFLLPSINQKLFLKCSMKWHYISTCFEHFSIFGPELWIHIVFKEDRWIKQQCHVRPPSWSDRAILTFSSQLILSVYMIFSHNHSLHQYHLCQQARAPYCWVLALTHEEPNCVKKWGESPSWSLQDLPKSFIHFLITITDDLSMWILDSWFDTDCRLLTHTLPSAVIMASIVPLCNQNLLPTWDQNGRLPLSTANCRSRTSISCPA